MIGFICSRNLAEMFSVLFVWMKLAGIKQNKKKSLPISRMIPTRKLWNLLNKKLKRKSRNTANSRSCVGHYSLTQINSPTVKPSNYNLFCKIITTLLFVMPWKRKCADFMNWQITNKQSPDGQNGFRRRKKVRFPHRYGLQFKKKNGSPA